MAEVNTTSTITDWIVIIVVLFVMASIWTALKEPVYNFGQSYPIISTVSVAVICGFLWWFLVVKGPKASAQPAIQQSIGNVSGGSTVNQAGRDQTIINPGVPESIVRKILSDKAISANKKLGDEYSLGCVLMGVTNGKVIFQPKSDVFRFDPDNDIAITIDDTKKTAAIEFRIFKFATTKENAGLQIDHSRMGFSYIENVPTPLNFFAVTLPDGTRAYPYVEVLDEANKIFVLGFKETPPP